MNETIILDIGHGGRDPGAIGNGLQEKDVNLAIGLKVRDALIRKYEVRVLMTRTRDLYVSNSDKVRMANRENADYYVALHANGWGVATAEGYEDFIWNGLADTTHTAVMRNKVHDPTAAAWTSSGSRNRGKKKANFQVLRETKMPAILLENGFVTNLANAKLLKDPKFLTKLSNAIAEGIANAAGLIIKPTAVPPPSSGKLYKVQIGSFSNKANADRQVIEAKAKGFKDAFIVVE